MLDLRADLAVADELAEVVAVSPDFSMI